MAGRINPSQNLLELIPKRGVGYELDDKGGVVLLIPRFRGAILGKLIQPLLKKRRWYRLHLDELGSFVWLAMDGEQTVGAIAQLAEDRFRDKVSPAFERVGLFVRMLWNGKAIELEQPQKQELPLDFSPRR